MVKFSAPQKRHSCAQFIRRRDRAGNFERRQLKVCRHPAPMSDLFIEEAPGLAEQHVRVFDEVLFRLVQHLEFGVRLVLAERLADIPNAPRATVKNLALDPNIAVARPVLERSPRLGESELVEIALSKGQEHLLAISSRSSLTERVTDV